jgi:hypothetical protein
MDLSLHQKSYGEWNPLACFARDDLLSDDQPLDDECPALGDFDVVSDVHSILMQSLHCFERFVKPVGAKAIEDVISGRAAKNGCVSDLLRLVSN